MKKTKIIAMLLALTLVFSLVACSNNQDPTTPTNPSTTPSEPSKTPSEGDNKPAKDTLVVAVSAEPVTLDPSDQNDNASSMAIRQIFDTLLTQDTDMNIQPGLAESWEFTDNLTLKLNLRKNVKFHNGEPFTSADVLYSLERALNNPKVSSFISSIDITNSKAIDEYTVELKTNEPYVPLLANLAHTSISMVCKKAIEEAGDNVGTEPVGTGPFKFVKWEHGDRVELERNDEYWGTKPAFKNLTMRAIVENANRAIEVETGGVDIALSLAPNDGTRLKDTPDVNVFVYESVTTSGMQINTTAEPFTDVRVRQALNYACDYQAIGDSVYEGYGSRAICPMSTAVWAANTKLTPYTYDPEKAKALLKEAGYENGLPQTLVLVTNDNRQRIDTFEIMQNQLAAVGIKSEISVRDMATLASFVPGDYEIFMAGWGTTTGDPDTGLYQTFNSNSGTANSKRIQFRDPQIIELLEQGRAETDTEKRFELYQKAQELIWDACPWVWYWQTDSIDATTSQVKGYIPHPAGYYQNFNQVYFE